MFWLDQALLTADPHDTQSGVTCQVSGNQVPWWQQVELDQSFSVDCRQLGRAGEQLEFDAVVDLLKAAMGMFRELATVQIVGWWLLGLVEVLEHLLPQVYRQEE